jgi:cytochrome d ubiquinol oxidase subunit I
MFVGGRLATWVYNNQPMKFAAIELVPTTSDDVPETLFGYLNSDYEVVGGIPIPGLASILSDPSEGTSTVIQGLDEFPAESLPTIGEINVVHYAWDIMVLGGSLLALIAVWWLGTWVFRRDMPKSRLFLWVASGCGVLAVIVMEAGWTVSEVGRQPWIVYELMKVEDAATGNTGVWVTFVSIVLLYTALAAATVYVLRRMSKRYRDGESIDVPYGPSDAPDPIGDGSEQTDDERVATS